MDLATGTYDRELNNRAFWLTVLGSEVSADKLADMHPIRRLYKPPPPPKSAELKKAESKAGWAMIHEAMAAQAKRA